MEFRNFGPARALAGKRDLYIALTAPAVAFLAAKIVVNLYNMANSDGIPVRAAVMKAPSTRLLSTEEYERIPYPPDALPGGRDVSTPYGNIRAYEFGPEHGRRVLFVHGISTPCIALSSVATRLVKRGCRVMLFDLPGRGYSDCPDTNQYHQDINLFSTCMLSVLASSSLPWTTERFTLAGYSLGGGIAAAFTSFYPDLVESLVLIAPGGLLRPTRLSLASKILYSGLLPNKVVNYFVGLRLRVSTPKPIPPRKESNVTTDLNQFDWTQVPHSTKRRISVTAAVHAETGFDSDRGHDDEEIDPHAPGQDSQVAIFDDRPHISPATAVQWQVNAHPGFIPAFISCIKYAPIHDGHAYWRLIGQRCAAQRAKLRKHQPPQRRSGVMMLEGGGRKHSTAGSETASSSSSTVDSAISGMHERGEGLDENKVLVLLGKKDVIIPPEETAQDVTEALGKDNVEIWRINGGHDLVLSNVEGVVKAICSFWEGGLQD